MTLIEIFAILIIHWIADFVFQTDEQAKGKSKNWTSLLSHTFDYSSIWLMLGLCWVYICPSGELFRDVLCFVVITFSAHTVTDYFTSRLNSKLWAKGDVHNFFVSVGFDQVLHYVQLFLTYYLLIK